MKRALITGGAGFFGEILTRRLLDAGLECVVIDLEKPSLSHPDLSAVQGDIRNREDLERAFGGRGFDVIYHCAAILAHAVKNKQFLWTSNVDGTRQIADCARDHRVPKVVFTSSNCLWGQEFPRPVVEDDVPRPVEIYGQSKWEGEKILAEYRDHFDSVIIRCPTIIDEGRLGLLAILFEFIDEGRKVWLVGGGENRYQFIYAQDLASACLKAVDYPRGNTFNIGSDRVGTLKETYEYVISKAATGARTASLPRDLTLQTMRLAYWLKLSPLGPYQYKMIASSFLFETSRIKRELGWEPTLNNAEMLHKSYEYYHHHRGDIERRKDVSAHKQAARMGIIRVLKWLS